MRINFSENDVERRGIFGVQADSTLEFINELQNDKNCFTG